MTAAIRHAGALLASKGIVAISQYRKVGCRITYSSGWPNKGSPFGRLEPYDGKLSRTVLRGERGGNTPDLPGKLEWNNKGGISFGIPKRKHFLNG